MMPQPGSQTIIIHILTNILSKDNQTMKFGQLTEYILKKKKEKNIFLEKVYTKCGGETIPRPSVKNQFSKKSKLSLSLDQMSDVLYSLLHCMPSWVDIIVTVVC